MLTKGHPVKRNFANILGGELLKNMGVGALVVSSAIIGL